MMQNKDKDSIKKRLDNLKDLLKSSTEDTQLVNSQLDDTTGQLVDILKSELSDKQREFLNLYLDFRFNITRICEAIEISRTTYYVWIEENAYFKQMIDHLDEALVDNSIETIQRALENGDAKIALAILKLKGKKRGFTESIDVTSNGQTIGIPTINIIMPKDDQDLDS